MSSCFSVTLNTLEALNLMQNSWKKCCVSVMMADALEQIELLQFSSIKEIKKKNDFFSVRSIFISRMNTTCEHTAFGVHSVRISHWNLYDVVLGCILPLCASKLG